MTILTGSLSSGVYCFCCCFCFCNSVLFFFIAFCVALQQLWRAKFPVNLSRLLNLKRKAIHAQQIKNSFRKLKPSAPWIAVTTTAMMKTKTTTCLDNVKWTNVEFASIHCQQKSCTNDAIGLRALKSQLLQVLCFPFLKAASPKCHLKTSTTE